jgi:cell division protein FtsB
MLGEIAFVENAIDYLRMEGVIAMAKQEIETLELEEKAIKRQLEAMKNVGGISLWPKPILHPIF